MNIDTAGGFAPAGRHIKKDMHQLRVYILQAVSDPENAVTDKKRKLFYIILRWRMIGRCR